MLFGDGPSAGGFAELGVPGLNFVSSAFGFYQGLSAVRVSEEGSLLPL